MLPHPSGRCTNTNSILRGGEKKKSSTPYITAEVEGTRYSKDLCPGYVLTGFLFSIQPHVKGIINVPECRRSNIVY
ncbi:unnamed protein product [Nezara viridula]|uniref:Uncharacterized protein n=1 Tax=Nezara viridula TaxID=85310 RepID=A0A9P0HTS2_NEZVI|nr:unnamed protein product [Nezara viridula]